MAALLALPFVCVFALAFTGCPMEATNNIRRVDVVLSDLFFIGGKAISGNNHGWLVPVVNEESGKTIWTEAPNRGDLSTDQHYDGVRLFNIDRDLGIKDDVIDAGPYDGVVFKYRTNVYNTEFRFRDFSFWFAWADEDIFPAFDYENGWENPSGEYKEVIIPFYKMERWGIPQTTGREDNDLTNFDPNQLSAVHIDGRSIMEGGGSTIWLEIVDFDFFYYE
jgi:hypothetical protein